MIMNEDRLLVDELRTILDEHSAHGATPIDRRAAVGRRIARHRRVRAVGAIAAIVVAAVGVTTAVLVPGSHTVPIVPAASPKSSLPEYADGGRLSFSSTIDTARNATGSLTFTPTSARMSISNECSVGEPDAYLAIQINGVDASLDSCVSGGSSIGSPLGQDQMDWSDLGVVMGRPTTLTFQVGVEKTSGLTTTVTPKLMSGTATIGVYNPVPFDTYPLPSKPSGWSITAPVRMNPGPGMHKIAQVGRFGHVGVSSPTTLTMPGHLEIMFGVNAPGIVHVLLNGVDVAECTSYGWNNGCDAGTLTAGKGKLADLKKGQQVVLTVRTTDVTVHKAVEIGIFGK